MLTLPILMDPLILDPTLTTELARFVNYQLIDSPFVYLEDGAIAPLAAETYEVSEDGKVYTIHLRKDAVWSDGVPVIAQHYIDGIMHQVHPGTEGDYAESMMGIEGALEFASGDADSIDGLKVLDDFNFQVTLLEPVSYFEYLLAFNVFQPIRRDRNEPNQDASSVRGIDVSNGAYTLSEHDLGNRIILEKNKLYWDAENVAYERIILPIIPEPLDCIIAFERGEVDAICGWPPGEMGRWIDRPEFVLAPHPGTAFLGINTLAEHTSDPDFRRALHYAIDKEILNDVILESPWKVEARGIIPPEIAGFQGDSIGFEFDASRAQAHLATYMERVGLHDPGEISIEVWFIRGEEDIYQALAAMWQKILGINVTLVPMKFLSFHEALEGCKRLID